jgi:choline dehydrogenase-like flavoprotein
MSVVDRDRKVYGIEKLRIADGSVMPRVTTGNTMALGVVIGERAAKILRTELQLRDTVAVAVRSRLNIWSVGFLTLLSRIQQIRVQSHR